MNKPSDQADAVTMSGGAYSLAVLGAKHVIDASGKLVTQALEAMPSRIYDDGFAFSDMGCADGGTSLGMIAATIDHVRARAPRAPITVYYTDQPRNDFNALITNVHGLGAFETYLGQHDDVYALISGTSFYQQVIPSGSLTLGYSATAMHWLSRKPGDLSNHVHMVGATGSELKAFAEQAQEDWRRILLHRAHELCTNGALVLVNFCIDESGRYLGNTGDVNMFDTFNEIWSSFRDDGHITSAEYLAMTLPQYYNTVEEFSKPLLDPNDPVHQAGLRLVSIETQIVNCPYAEDFARHGDVERFTEAYIPTIRTWNESTFFAGLSVERSTDERRALIEMFYETYKDRVRRDPKSHHMDYVHAYMVIEKV